MTTEASVRSGHRPGDRPPASRRRFRRDIEGLRAIAVLLVVCYHLGFSAFSGGFIGVDVFFVISGFLITHHLLTEAEQQGRVRLGRFYARRARRLLPAATTVLIVTAVAGYLLLSPDHYRNLATDVALATVYVVNWGFAHRAVDYLAEDASVSPVQHYWSLAVEEQFYVLVPLLILTIAVIVKRRGWSIRLVSGLVVTLIIALSFWYSLALTASDPARAFFVTPTRIWELAAGSLLACLFPVLLRLPPLGAQLLALAGLTCLAVALVLVDSSTAWPGPAALWPVLGTGAVIAAGTAHLGTAAGRMLSAVPLVWIGGLSYALYLWHWPLIVFAEASGFSGWPSTVAIVLLSVVLSIATRRMIEDPLRFGRAIGGLGRSALIAVVGMSLSLTAAFAVYVAVPNETARPDVLIGAEALLPDPASAPPVPHVGRVVPEPALAEDDYPVLYDDGCQIPAHSRDFRTDCLYGDPDGSITVALIGDSKAAQWLSPLDRIARAEGWRVQVFTRSACGVNPAHRDHSTPLCAEWIDAVIDHLTSPDGRADIVITSMGTSDPDLGVTVDPAYVEGHRGLWDDLAAVDTRVVALLDNPYPDRSFLPAGSTTTYGCVAAHRDDWSECTVPVTEGAGGREAMRMAAESMPDVVAVDLGELVCPESLCYPVIGDVLVFRQGSHLSDTYARSLQNELWRRLVQAGLADGSGLSDH